MMMMNGIHQWSKKIKIVGLLHVSIVRNTSTLQCVFHLVVAETHTLTYGANVGIETVQQLAVAKPFDKRQSGPETNGAEETFGAFSGKFVWRFYALDDCAILFYCIFFPRYRFYNRRKTTRKVEHREMAKDNDLVKSLQGGRSNK